MGAGGITAPPALGKTAPMYAELAAIVERNGGMWWAEAEDIAKIYLQVQVMRLS